MAKLHGLTYKSPIEELSEKFHMSEDSPRTAQSRRGFRLGPVQQLPWLTSSQWRCTTGRTPSKPSGRRASRSTAEGADTIVVDKPAREVRAYTKDGQLIGFYPATIGSDEKPAPTGTFKGEARRLEFGLSLRSKVRVEKCKDQTKADHRSRPK